MDGDFMLACWVYSHSVCVPVSTRVHDDNLQMRLPEEKRRSKSTVSVSAPHTKTAERMVPRTVYSNNFLQHRNN